MALIYTNNFMYHSYFYRLKHFNKNFANVSFLAFLNYN